MVSISQHLGDLEEIAENSARNGGYVETELYIPQLAEDSELLSILPAYLQPSVSAFAPVIYCS